MIEAIKRGIIDLPDFPKLSASSQGLTPITAMKMTDSYENFELVVIAGKILKLYYLIDLLK